MVRHGGSSAGSFLADTTSPIPSHCASIVAISTLRVEMQLTRTPSSVRISPVQTLTHVSYHVLIHDQLTRLSRTATLVCVWCAFCAEL